MENNEVIDSILGKVPQAKEVIQNIEQKTGKKISDVASEIGNKITDAMKEQGQDNPKDVLGDIANKLLGKKD